VEERVPAVVRVGPYSDETASNDETASSSTTSQPARGTSVHAPSPEERPRNAEEQQAYYQAAEPAIVAGLLEEDSANDVAVAEFPNHQIPLQKPDGTFVMENGKRKTVPLRVRFRKIGDKDVEAAQGKATIWLPNKTVRNGPKEPHVRQDVMRAWLIYEATVPEDKRAIWDQSALWTKHRVGNGPELVESLLSVGEKMQAVAVIYGHSDLLEGESQEEAVGNA
jgi:hypothetical protein